MGPASMNDHQNMDVPPHPHIGLSTLTYLFEGSIMHKDSLGTEMEIKPGAVNWMTAGKGIVHSERTPAYLRNADKHLHGLQIWVALPRELEEMQPSFVHVEAHELPVWTENNLTFKLIAGEALGKKSPVPVFSPLYFIEIKSTGRQTVNIGDHLFGECALYIMEGQIDCEETTFVPKQLLVAKNSALCEFEMAENSTIYIFGGEAFPEERFIYWNFVSSSKERIEQAKQMWLAQTFERVPGETEFVPLPQSLQR
ncbi:MAG TPA: pirin family protein [Bacteroidia bacterium]|nr:pirin family protein [Bacteroidia bacterium]